MVDCLEEGLHVACGRCLGKSLIGLLRNLLKQLCAGDVLHDEVDVLLIVVGLVVLDDVRMIERVQDGNLFHDAVNIIAKFDLIENFYGDLEIFVMFVGGKENAAKRTNSENFSL